MTTKQRTCPDCGVTGGVDVFYVVKSRSGAERLHHKCKECWKKEVAGRAAKRNIKRGIYPPTEQTCPDCGINGGQELFSRDPRRKTGLYLYCRQCKRKRYLARGDEEKTLNAICKTCGVSGGPDLFNRTNCNKSGLSTHCKRCSAIATRRKRFGVGFDRIDVGVDPSCEICGVQLAWHQTSAGKNTAVHVDHCHQTGKIRGLLCHDCNTGIGKFKDNPSLLWKAIAYLGMPRG